MKLASKSCCGQDSSSSRKENNKEEENFNGEHSVRSLVVPILLPIQILPVTGSIEEPGV